jgi:hypothetical protein
MMHGREKSDSAIVAGKPTNKAVSTAAEPVERRAEAKGNASQQSTRRTQSRVSVSQALERIRQAVTKNALPSHTQGGSRMPELGPYGSVRGALSNERPYRDLRNVAANYPFERSHRFAGIQPNSGHRDCSRLSCGVGDTQQKPVAGVQGARHCLLPGRLAGARPHLRDDTTYALPCRPHWRACRTNFEACITHLRFPLAHRQAIRTTDEMDKRFFS